MREKEHSGQGLVFGERGVLGDAVVVDGAKHKGVFLGK
jgi:hypothetical protein